MMQDMGMFTFWHLLILLIVLAAMIIPFWKILPRAGIPAPLALVSIIPFGALVLLWVLAFKQWPEDK